MNITGRSYHTKLKCHISTAVRQFLGECGISETLFLMISYNLDVWKNGRWALCAENHSLCESQAQRPLEPVANGQGDHWGHFELNETVGHSVVWFEMESNGSHCVFFRSMFLWSLGCLATFHGAYRSMWSTEGKGWDQEVEQLRTTVVSRSRESAGLG